MCEKVSEKLFSSNDWGEKDIQRVWSVIDKLAKEKYNLDYYDPEFVIVDYETMIVLTSVTAAMPLTYTHWSQGKEYFKFRDAYKNNQTNLSYEMIINSNPARCYLLDKNTLTGQTVVMCHAAVGHSAFFKNNYIMKEGMDPRHVLELFTYAKNYIEMCEQKYGEEEVAELLDYAHALSHHSVDVSKSRKNNNLYQRAVEYNAALEKNYNELYKNFDKKMIITQDEEEDDCKWEFPEYNLMKYIIHNSPNLHSWEKEVLSIVSALQQYFVPNYHTKLMNEGYATFWHNTLMRDLHDMGHLTESSMFEYIEMNCGVIHQHNQFRPMRGLNPYKIGSEIFSDIRRICENPTDEDREYFPFLVGKNWVDEVQFAMKHFNDSSFILQYLSPHVVRKLKFVIAESYNLSEEERYENGLGDDVSAHIITEIHSDEDFLSLRKKIADCYTYEKIIPSIYIGSVSENYLHLVHHKNSSYPLHQEDAEETIKYMQLLMGERLQIRLTLLHSNEN
jgi:spore cortex formation protein SpoVR/YcgB (stage V sporulation)